MLLFSYLFGEFICTWKHFTGKRQGLLHFGHDVLWSYGESLDLPSLSHGSTGAPSVAYLPVTV